MRVFLAIFFFSMFQIWSVEAGEPIVVLTYGESRENSGAMQDEYETHPMRVDPNAYKTHKVKEAETLGHIMAEHYGGSGLDMKFVELAILQFNRKAFVRGNPNFLYAGKTLHLPSVNQMRALLTGEKSAIQNLPDTGNQNEIFFFGG